MGRHTAKPTDLPGKNGSIYDNRLTPLAFDFLIASVFLPFGGIRRIRERALELLDLRPRMQVLELGCGTGGFTALLLERGILVTAIDGSRRMLGRAEKRARGARFIRSQIEEFEPSGQFDRVFFAFVLHELSEQQRAAAVAIAAAATKGDGLVAILDYSVPDRGWLARVWRASLLRFEPPSVADCIDRGYDAELVENGFEVVSSHSLGRGLARLTLARPALRHASFGLGGRPAISSAQAAASESLPRKPAEAESQPLRQAVLTPAR